MDVIVDGERNFEVEGAPENLLSVIAAITAFLRDKGRAMVSLEVNGRNIKAEKMQEEVETIALDEVQSILVTSEEIGVMVEECLRELSQNLPELPKACRSLAEVFHGETPEEGFEPFTQLASIWETIKNRELLVISALNLDIDALAVEGLSINEMHQELNQYLEEAAQALKDTDCILLGDLLEYELAPRAEQEAEIIALLQERASAQTGGS